MSNGKLMEITANVVPTISGVIERNPMSKLMSKRMETLINSVKMADTIPTEKEISNVDVLIGNDYYLDIVLPERIEVETGLYLLSSRLGWILTGRTLDTKKETAEPSFLILTYGNDVTRNSVFSNVDKVIPERPAIEDLWNIESIGIIDKLENNNDEIAMKIFRETLKFEENRYQVTWPWREEELELPVNRQLAIGRLRSTVGRLRNNPELLKKYNSIIEDQINKGVIERVDNQDQDRIRHYIPHHAVITPVKSTTKLRVVYDASAKSREDYKSLNECLYRGPVILQDLCGILLRFRLHKIAIVSDIEKAFLQIGLQKDQRDVTRFLWLNDCDVPSVKSSNIQEFRFCRIPFGIISSPFLLGATIQCHLDRYNTEISVKMKNNFYVDNLITGTDTESEAIDLYNGAKEIFRTASMNLREWCTNSEIVNKIIPKEDKACDDIVSVLGLCWDPLNDALSLKEIKECDSKTKRSILRTVTANFDPLGLFAPVLLKGKLLIQQLWSNRIDWDRSIPDDIQNAWIKIKTDLECISKCRLPRCVLADCDYVNAEHNLVCFCDASSKAYSTAIYLHKSSNDESKAELIFAKSRLAPLKGMSIPKLEIMAVLIGVRCTKFVQNQLQLEIQGTYLFTDSQCVLKWISTKKDLPVFVKNRVVEIKEHTNVKFSYVNTTENPADVATRGTSVENLNKHELWWSGPNWLKKPIIDWPNMNGNDISKEELNAVHYAEPQGKPEMKEKQCKLNNGDSMDTPLGINYNSFSSFTKLLRVTSLALRFIRNLKNRIQLKETMIGPLLSSEISNAEIVWIQYVQRKHFTEVFTSIDDKRKNNLQHQLNLYIDENGLLRCKGRLQFAGLSEGSRFPLLLPKNDRFTHLLIEKYHTDILHSGVSQTLSYIRSRFWIPQGRARVKSVLNQCKVCRRFEGGPYKVPLMPPLPKSRVTESQPFTYTGLDYFGPLYIKTPGEKKKVWICLYTCLVTRAVHLELVLDMTTEEFLLGFRRFISQRGVPLELISDNALQFKTAGTTLDLAWSNVLNNDDVQSYVADKKIKWTYIVELAPWMGGFYERLVGVIKRSMRKTLGRKL